ncbi:MAG: hypothetical protein K8R87_11340 [Verrucomicrobia bacterium]|nr:hypothetical protein [Verrucomicrobiota bacterium]
MMRFDLQSVSDNTVIAILMTVFAIFAWTCLPRKDRVHRFYSFRLLLSFTVFFIFAFSAWLKLNDRIGLAEQNPVPFVTQVQDRLTAGFILLAMMIIIHSLICIFSAEKD